MRETWVGVFLGTRRRGLAPVDVLLLVALICSLAAGAARLLHLASPVCSTIGIIIPVEPAIWWNGGASTDSFDLPDQSPPIGVVATMIHDSDAPSASFDFDDGQPRIGDRLLSAHLDGKRWVKMPAPGSNGFWQATGWTFTVLHQGTRRRMHLTISAPFECS